MTRIAIVGGGMAGLAAAFELTRTPALQKHFQVTIYQMGWRLGGKAASSRDGYGRIVEHGLHVWFGCYENAFRLLGEAYREWKPQAGQAIMTTAAALRGQDLTMIGSGVGPDVAVMRWPTIEGTPGDGSADLSVWATIAQVQRVIHHLSIQVFAPKPAAVPREPALKVYLDSFTTRFADAKVKAKRFRDNPAARTEPALRRFVGDIRSASRDLLAATSKADPGSVFRAQLIDVGTAVVKGVIVDVVLGGLTVLDLDRMDFRDWLSLNGADRSSVYDSSVVRALYDSMLQYCEGDPRRPSYGAGTAAQVVMRLYGTYVGSFVYELAAGMGEVVVVPFYRVLRQRGVQFEFFHKLKRLELSGDRSEVAQARFDRQVWLRNGCYEPTKPPAPENGHLECWPDEPLWDQIKDVDKLGCRNLESHWCLQSVEERVLQRGHDFDEVVLAIPVSAFMTLNEDPSPCAELIEANNRFRLMTEAASPVPSISVQVWLTRPATSLQGASGKNAQLSTGPRPLNIWADRSRVLSYEHWPRGGPRSVQYLCDVMETQLYQAPVNTDFDVQGAANDRARALAALWFMTKAKAIWPGAAPAGTFDWSFLYDPDGGVAEGRLGFQVVKANVDPSECCAGSPAGSTASRLATDDSGFRNLFLAGAWIDTGFNTECIEAAIMSGRQAARAIARLDFDIPGEGFLWLDLGLLGIASWLVADAANLVERYLTWSRERRQAEAVRRVVWSRAGRQGRAP